MYLTKNQKTRVPDSRFNHKLKQQQSKMIYTSSRFNCLFLIVVALAIIFPPCEAFTMKFLTVWFKHPYRGSQCVLHVVGADLDPVASDVDQWSKPDVLVECRHCRWKNKTPIEANTFKPRWLYQTKMPHKTRKGFGFTVYDANVMKENIVLGKAFLSAKDANELKASNGSKVLSLGEGVGSIKVSITKVPKKLNKKINSEQALESGDGTLVRVEQ